MTLAEIVKLETDGIPRGDVPKILGRLEELKAELWLRLIKPPPPVAPQPAPRRADGSRPAIAPILVRDQRLFKVQAAANYMGISDDSLKKYTDLGQITAYVFNRVRVYKVDDLDALIDQLPKWDDRNEP